MLWMLKLRIEPPIWILVSNDNTVRQNKEGSRPEDLIG